VFTQNRIYLGMTTIKDLIIKRPNLKSEFLDILLNFSFHEKAEVCLVGASLISVWTSLWLCRCLSVVAILFSLIGIRDSGMIDKQLLTEVACVQMFSLQYSKLCLAVSLAQVLFHVSSWTKRNSLQWKGFVDKRVEAVMDADCGDGDCDNAIWLEWSGSPGGRWFPSHSDA